MNNINLMQNALNKIANETAYTFTAEDFDLDENKTVTFADFARADDTIEALMDDTFDASDIEDENEAIEWWKWHAESQCAKSSEDPSGYQPSDIDRLLSSNIVK